MTNWDYFIKAHLSFLDILSVLIWLIILAMAVFFIQRTIQDHQMRKMYGWNFFFKLVFGLAYVFYYAGVFRGGDTINYWNTANLMADMFYRSPSLYFQHLMSENNMTNLYYYFNWNTGYPSSDIYYKPENYFTAKVFSVIAILTYKSYVAGTLIMVFITSDIHWRFFRFIKNSNLKTTKWMPLLVLFIPSVAFWTSGISKDTLMLISIFSIVYLINSMILKQRKFTWKAVALVLLHVYLIINVRSMILAIVIVPFLFTAMRQVYHALRNQQFLKRIVQVSFNIVIFTGLIFFFMSSIKDTFLQESATFNEAMVKQQDFANNLTYGDNKYDLNLKDANFFGIIAKTPLIIATGIYRPFLWEALSISLILNGVESVVLLFFSGRFLFNRFRSRIQFIFQDRFLNYSFIFVIFTAFIAGFISILFGVLVRFRAPLLPFIGLLLTVEPERKQVREEN